MNICDIRKSDFTRETSRQRVVDILFDSQSVISGLTHLREIFDACGSRIINVGLSKSFKEKNGRRNLYLLQIHAEKIT